MFVDQKVARIEIKSGEFKVSNCGSEDFHFITNDLGDDVAIAFFSQKLLKIALARNIDNEQLKKLINEMNPNKVVVSGLIRVCLFGGKAGSQESSKYVE